MIDAHCHFDMAKNPVKYITDNEKKRIITIGMTNLPSHFQMGINNVKRYRYIRLALGLHPLRADEHAKEYSRFLQQINETSYIGEVGLDFSKAGLSTKEIQIKSFEFVLDNVKGKKKILSIHSRRAEKDTLEMLLDRNIPNAIFHWYSGSVNLLNKIADADYFFSINSAMISSENGKKIISKIPKELILTETDFPFIENSSIISIYSYLSSLWNMPESEVEQIIDGNFRKLINRII
ncbi:MAG: TatD family hydrolase [Proteiniphilum sp.]|jgi:TatD DNase family protein|uniref:TatD family hydrolase n=1 Tax=Proteiniphilum sp. TaxID=1926877 RepID=UPI002B218B04|nr:TatD family hydrolase [Proteiniphilum sp.]MEA5126908.1 TatD family hydrolase [Proteiniphilum sp.]